MKGGKKALLAAAAVAGVTTTTTSTTTDTSSSTTETTATTSPTTTTTTTTTPTTTTTTINTIAVPSGYTVVSARDFGVVCDGVVDDTSKLQAALNGLAQYQALMLPAGTCRYSNWLNMPKTNAAVIGAGKDLTILQATDPAASSFVVPTGSAYVTLAHFQIYSPNTTSRRSDGLSRGIYVDRAHHVTIDNVKVRNVANAGILLRTTADSWVTNSIVEKSWADAFHVTNGATNVTLQSNTAIGSGDDCFASIGPGASTGMNRNISFLDGVCTDSHWASGVSFEGTDGGKAYRNRIVGTGAACIRIDSQQSYNTGPVNNIDLQDNYLDGCDMRKINHGGVIIYTNLYTVGSTITFARTTIKNTGHGFRIFGQNGQISRATAIDSTMFVSTAFKVEAGGSLIRSGNTNNGAAAN